MRLLASGKIETGDADGLLWAFYDAGGVKMDRDVVREIAIMDDSIIETPFCDGPGAEFVSRIVVRRNRKGRHILVTQNYGLDI
jgi:hypothetical protein